MLTTYHAQALDHLKAAHAVALAPDAVRANELLDVGDALHETEGALADRILMRESTDRLAGRDPISRAGPPIDRPSPQDTRRTSPRSDSIATSNASRGRVRPTL